MRIPLIATAADLVREVPEEPVQAEKPRALAYIEAIAACAILVAAGLALAAS
jgi:hypothetical protein